MSDGKSNQEIADRLVISLNTILHHVSSIFAKTGTANRAEAASWAVSAVGSVSPTDSILPSHSTHARRRQP
jgi:DNA-binding CsgD family transcriptional regulator